MSSENIVEDVNGLKTYYKILKLDDKQVRIRHRDDGPAVIDTENSLSFWYANNILFTESTAFCEEVGMNNEETMVFVLKHGHDLSKKDD